MDKDKKDEYVKGIMKMSLAYQMDEMTYEQYVKTLEVYIIAMKEENEK